MTAGAWHEPPGSWGGPMRRLPSNGDALTVAIIVLAAVLTRVAMPMNGPIGAVLAQRLLLRPLTFATIGLAAVYLARVVMPRPPVGLFVRSDVYIMIIVLVVMPFAYLAIPVMLVATIFGIVMLIMTQQTLAPLIGRPACGSGRLPALWRGRHHLCGRLAARRPRRQRPDHHDHGGRGDEPVDADRHDTRPRGHFRRRPERLRHPRHRPQRLDRRTSPGGSSGCRSRRCSPPTTTPAGIRRPRRLPAIDDLAPGGGQDIRPDSRLERRRDRRAGHRAGSRDDDTLPGTVGGRHRWPPRSGC